MRGRVLIIEDVTEMRDLIALYLHKEQIMTEGVATAEEGLQRLRDSGALQRNNSQTESLSRLGSSGDEDKSDKNNNGKDRAGIFNLIILDLNLPGMDGFDFLRALRRTSEIPVIIVSAREADEDLVLGLGLGADEFVTKPFSPRVLAARVRALLRRIAIDRDQLASLDDRRTANEAVFGVPQGRVINFGPYQMDREAYMLKKYHNKIALSVKEFEVFEFLIAQNGKACSPQYIFDSLWNNTYGDISTVGVYIQRIRKKIEADHTNPHYIITVHGKGYRFNTETILPENPSSFSNNRKGSDTSDVPASKNNPQ